MLEAALDLARFGFYVFPILPNSKKPAVTEWQHKASNEPVAIKAMFDWAMHKHGPSVNIGILMGQRTGLIGLDIDYDDGADPEFIKRLPVSWTVRTGKGHHVFYRLPSHWPAFGKLPLQSSTKAQGPGRPKDCVTARCNNHYFVAVGSRHPETGTLYAWAKYEGWAEGVSADLLCPGEDGVELAEAPEWFLEAMNKPSERAPGHKYPENERHAMFLSTAAKMAKQGKSCPDIVARLTERNIKDCNPPKVDAEEEILRCAEWATKTIAPDPTAVADEAARSRARSNPSIHAGRHNGQSRREYAPPSDSDRETSTIDPDQPEESSPSQSHSNQIAYKIIPLGHLDNDYFYLSTSNKQICKLADSHHKSVSLLNLAPIAYWEMRYPKYREGEFAGVDWIAAASALMLSCREIGIFNTRRMRGAGAWHDSGKLVLHLGNFLIVDGHVTDLLNQSSRFTYRLGPDYPAPRFEEATVEDCRTLIEACKAPQWEKPQSAVLLAGMLGIMRICGALPWRPHLWLTGPAGCGKTSLMNTLIKTMGGGWAAYFGGDTTGAGIRQGLGCDSRPVIFDESETNNKQSSGKVQQVVALARQGSSESDAYIVKGTPGGKSLEFKVSSSFILASIRVNLTDEADQTRFCVLELSRPLAGTSVADFDAKLNSVDGLISERIFYRFVKRYDQLLANYEILRRQIASVTSQRHGQQYGMLLAGYAVLASDCVLTEEQAANLIVNAGVAQPATMASDSADEKECVDHIMDSQVRLLIDSNTSEGTIRGFVETVALGASPELRSKLQEFGVDTLDGYVYVAAGNPQLARLFSNTAWERNWTGSLGRVPGAARGCVHWFGKQQKKSVKIPLDYVVKQRPAEPDKGIL